MKRFKVLLLPLILISYALLYIATTKVFICNEDCNNVMRVDTTLTRRYNYVWNVARCGANVVTDTLCIYVKDTAGINWDLFADTTCQVATQVGLSRQKIFIIKATTPFDTLVKKQCP